MEFKILFLIKDQVCMGKGFQIPYKSIKSTGVLNDDVTNSP